MTTGQGHENSQRLKLPPFCWWAIHFRKNPHVTSEYGHNMILQLQHSTGSLEISGVKTWECESKRPVTTWQSWTWGFEKHLIHKTIGPPTKKTQKRHQRNIHSIHIMYDTNLERLYWTLVQDFIICLISNDNIQPAMRTWSHWALWPQGFNLRHAPASSSPRPRRTKNGEKPSRWCRQNS